MSYLTEAASQAQIQQIIAVKNLNELVLNALRQNVAALENAQLPSALKDSLAPLHEVFGSRAEYAALFADSLRAWAQIAHDVSTEAADIFASSAAA